MLVEIDNDTLLGMLLDRCDAWSISKENKDLFEKMYESYLDSGVWEQGEFNVNSIVDNDTVNYCTVLYKGDEDFEEVLSLYKENGVSDISCETLKSGNSYGFIEAVSDDEERILLRY